MNTQTVDPYSTAVVSAIGALIALTTIFLYLAAVYLGVRVYKQGKLKMLSKAELDEEARVKNSQKIPDRE